MIAKNELHRRATGLYDALADGRHFQTLASGLFAGRAERSRDFDYDHT